MGVWHAFIVYNVTCEIDAYTIWSEIIIKSNNNNNSVNIATTTTTIHRCRRHIATQLPSLSAYYQRCRTGPGPGIYSKAI